MSDTCQVTMFAGLPCGRPLIDEGGCIFHVDEKERDVFTLALKDYIASKKDDTQIDFSSFIFPETMEAKDFSIIKKHLGEKEIIFDSAVFKGVAHFWNAEFLGGVFFNAVKFEGGAVFQRAKFKTVDFTAAEFFGDVSFRKAEFGVDISTSTTIEEELYGQTPITFASAEFFGSADFTLAQFHRNFCFESVFIHNNAVLLFHNIDLSKGTFLNTTISDNVNFINEQWNVVDGRQAVYDEIIAKKARITGNYSYIAILYRQLRLNYEKRMAYSSASSFQLGEMEMRLLAALNKENRFLKFIPQNIDYYLLPFYKWFSDFGERSFRPLLWIIFAWVAFAALYHGIGFERPFVEFNYALLYSFMAMIFVPTENMVINIIKEYLWLVRLEQVIVTVLVVLLVLSIRRAMKR